MTVGGPVLTTERSADPVTVVGAVEVLFTAFGSGVGDDTVAVFEKRGRLGRRRDHHGDGGSGRKGACPGMWVLVAADGQSELPVIDGREVPLISSGQRARVPDPG